MSRESLLNICHNIAGNRQITAACLYGPLINGYGDEKCDVDLLLIVNGFASQLKTYRRPLTERKSLILAVDKGVFERDVSSGWFGEIVADKLLTLYEPFINSDYLLHQEVVLKRRIIWELLEALILEFPELSQELLIEKEYFMHETQMQRARLFQPITYRFLNMLRNDLREKNMDGVMKGYRKALEELDREKWIAIRNSYVKVTPKMIDAVKSRRIRIPIFLRTVQRTAFFHFFTALPRMMTPMDEEERLHFRSQASPEAEEDLTAQLDDPKNYLLVSTPVGPIPLSDATTIEEFLRKTIPGGAMLRVETVQIGGVLNSVYLLKLKNGHQEQRVVVKKFKDWTGFKWFPLSLWALGTKSFAMLGKSRLEREYAINQFMQNEQLSVPKVLYISPKQSLIFQEYVEGKTLSETIKNIISGKNVATQELELVREAGRRIAQAHLLGVGLGDCKPENIIVTKEGRLFFVDLEQASRNGNQPWDIAEFLYYCGHYVPPLSRADTIEIFAKTFIEGYIEAGGKVDNIKKAASPRYTKVFTIFTQPQIILAIANVCRKVNQP